MALNGADVILVITVVLAFILMIVAAIYFIVYFQHPDDKVPPWPPRLLLPDRFS